MQAATALVLSFIKAGGKWSSSQLPLSRTRFSCFDSQRLGYRVLLIHVPTLLLT